MLAIALKSIQISDRKAIICRLLKKHPSPRADHELKFREYSSKKYCIVPNLLTADTFYFRMTTTAKEVKANTIFTGFYQLTETRSQLRILSISKLALKHTKLHPLTIGLEDFMYLSTAFIFRDIVRDDQEHYFITNGGYLSISSIRYLANNLA